MVSPNLYKPVNSLTILLHTSPLLLHISVTHAILEIVLHRLIMVNLSYDANVPKDSSNNDKAEKNGGTPKSVSSVNVDDIDEFCLHDLKDMVVKLGYDVADLMYYYFFRPRLGLDYGLYTLNVDADVLEMAKYVKDNKIILVYFEHGSSNVDSIIFVTPKKAVAIAIDNYLRKAPIEIDSSPDLASYVEGPIVVESADDPFKDLDEILGNSSTVDDVLDLQMQFETEGVGPIGKFKEVEHDEVFDDDEHIVEDVPVSMNNFNFTADPKHDLSIGAIEVQEHDLDVIDYDSFGSDLDDEIDYERRIQLRELRRIGKQKNKGLDGCFISSPWPGQILTAVGVDANNVIYPVAYSIVKQKVRHLGVGFRTYLERILGLIQVIAFVFLSAEHMYCVRHIHENMKSQFKEADPIFQSSLMLSKRATRYIVQWNGGHLYQVTGPYRDRCVVNMDRRACSCRKWELTGIPCKHDVAAIYNMSENSVGVGEH
ncbi:mutator type transposase [Tanacetum coccineum]